VTWATQRLDATAEPIDPRPTAWAARAAPQPRLSRPTRAVRVRPAPASTSRQWRCVYAQRQLRSPSSNGPKDAAYWAGDAISRMKNTHGPCLTSTWRTWVTFPCCVLLPVTN